MSDRWVKLACVSSLLIYTCTSPWKCMCNNKRLFPYADRHSLNYKSWKWGKIWKIFENDFVKMCVNPESWRFESSKTPQSTELALSWAVQGFFVCVGFATQCAVQRPYGDVLVPRLCCGVNALDFGTDSCGHAGSSTEEEKLNKIIFSSAWRWWIYSSAVSAPSLVQLACLLYSY